MGFSFTFVWVDEGMKTSKEIDCGTPGLEYLSRSFLMILATYKITFKLKEIRG